MINLEEQISTAKDLIEQINQLKTLVVAIVKTNNGRLTITKETFKQINWNDLVVIDNDPNGDYTLTLKEQTHVETGASAH